MTYKNFATSALILMSLLAAGCGWVADIALEDRDTPSQHETTTDLLVEDDLLEEAWLEDEWLEDTWDEAADEALQAVFDEAWSSYVGLGYQDAIALAQSRWQSYRIVMLEWIPQKVSLDDHPDRVNFSIEGWIVVDVSFG